MHNSSYKITTDVSRTLYNGNSYTFTTTVLDGILFCSSIVVDDVDGRRNRSQNHCKKEETPKTEQKNHQSQEQVSQSVQNPYPRHVLEDAIRDILVSEKPRE